MTVGRSAAVAMKFVLERPCGGSTAADVVLAIAAPLAAAAVWSRYAAPRSPRRLRRAPRVALESCVFALAALALAAAGAPVAAAVFAAVVALDSRAAAQMGIAGAPRSGRSGRLRPR
jgi:hypothetical protein